MCFPSVHASRKTSLTLAAMSQPRHPSLPTFLGSCPPQRCTWPRTNTPPCCCSAAYLSLLAVSQRVLLLLLLLLLLLPAVKETGSCQTCQTPGQGMQHGPCFGSVLVMAVRHRSQAGRRWCSGLREAPGRCCPLLSDAAAQCYQGLLLLLHQRQPRLRQLRLPRQPRRETARCPESLQTKQRGRGGEEWGAREFSEEILNINFLKKRV